MIVHWLKFFGVAISPGSATPGERPRYARMASWIKNLGLGFLVLAAGAMVWWLVERQSYGSLPVESVPIQDFSEEDLQGRLREARIQGVLQLDQILATRNSSGYLSALIPLTQADWRPDDPIRVFIQTHLFLYDQQVQLTGDKFESGLNHLGLPADSRGATQVSLIVKQPTRPTTLPGASKDDVILVTYVKETWRERDISKETDGILEISKIVGAMGMLFALIGFFARRSILRHVD